VNVVVCGHVDHGKSTIVGRLLADTRSLPEGKLEAIQALCERTSRPFEYAFLLDTLRDERAQGITIDSARVFFRTRLREYAIIDAPGHVEFLKHMISGASRAVAALLVVDAGEGLQENSRRHAFLLSLLGIGQVVVLVNKMDLVGYDAARFAAMAAELRDFLARVGLAPAACIPVSGRAGDNLTARAAATTPWYDGPTVLEALDTLAPALPAVDRPLRMPVQDVYKFTRAGDDRRIVAGTVETGRLRTGDEVVFYPSGKRGRVRSIEGVPGPRAAEVAAGTATGFTLEQQIYVARGEVVARAGEPPPRVTTRLRVSLVWLGTEPLRRGAEYGFRLGTARVRAHMAEITGVIDAAELAPAAGRDRVERHEVADGVLELSQAVAVDLVDDCAATGRFVLVDAFDIRGGGIVREALADPQDTLRTRVQLRNAKWEPSQIPGERRAERFGHRPLLILVTGELEKERKELAKALEARLFADGHTAYYLGIGSLLYGVDADIERSRDNRHEHLRRLAEVGHILLDAGMILVVTAAELTAEEVAIIRTAVGPDPVHTVWVGDRVTTDLACDDVLGAREAPDAGVARVTRHLQERGALLPHG
jgi:bifunctional enzyme CysN/CysC